MASRKEQKEQARAQRLAKEQEAAARVRRTRRIQIFGGAILAAVVVVVVAVVVSSGGGSGGTPANSAKARSDYAQVKSLLSGIPQSGTTLGNPRAKVTLTYFGDLECPDCQAFTLTQDYLPQFIQDQVRTNKVKLVYRSFCTATCYKNPLSTFREQQVAAYAAGMQRKFWQFADLFYREQQSEDVPYVTPAWLTNLAKQIPTLKLAKWNIDQKDPTLTDQVDSELEEAKKLKLQGTPTLIMSGPKGAEQVNGPLLGTEDGHNQYAIPDYSELVAAAKAVS